MVSHQAFHLVTVRPDVGQVHCFARCVGPQWLAGEVEVHPSSQGVGYHQRRAHQEGRPDAGVDAALEVAVARQRCRKDDLSCCVGLLDPFD